MNTILTIGILTTTLIMNTPVPVPIEGLVDPQTPDPQDCVLVIDQDAFGGLPLNPYNLGFDLLDNTCNRIELLDTHGRTHNNM